MQMISMARRVVSEQKAASVRISREDRKWRVARARVVVGLMRSYGCTLLKSDGRFIGGVQAGKSREPAVNNCSSEYQSVFALIVFHWGQQSDPLHDPRNCVNLRRAYSSKDFRRTQEGRAQCNAQEKRP